MNETEIQRNDSNCIKVVGDRTLQINHKYCMADSGTCTRATSSTMSWIRPAARPKFTKGWMWMNSLMLQSKVTVPPSLHMGRLALEKLIPWQARKNYSLEMCMSVIKGKESFPGQYSNCGRRSKATRISTLLKPAILRFTINRLRIYSICPQEYSTVDGTQPMVSLSRISLL